MRFKAWFAIAAILIAGCGSEDGATADSNDGGAPTTNTTGPSGPTSDGSGGNTGTDQDAGTGAGGQDSGSTTDQDSGSTGGDQDSGTGGGDQDGGVTQDSGSGGGDQDGGTTGQDSGSGGGSDDGGTTNQDSGSGGGDQDSGSGGGQDSGSGGGDQDGGTTTGDSGSGGGGHDDGGEQCTPHSCTHTQGYYKNHTSEVTGLVLGGVSYSQSQILGFLNATPNGDDSLILAKQLVAALLNGGACDPNASATVAAAQSWMAANKDQDGTLPYGTCCVNQSDPGCTAYTLGQTLDSYNSGYAGTPHCQ